MALGLLLGWALFFGAVTAFVFFSKLGTTYSRVWLGSWFILGFTDVLTIRVCIAPCARMEFRPSSEPPGGCCWRWTRCGRGSDSRGCVPDHIVDNRLYHWGIARPAAFPVRESQRTIYAGVDISDFYDGVLRHLYFGIYRKAPENHPERVYFRRFNLCRRRIYRILKLGGLGDLFSLYDRASGTTKDPNVFRAYMVPPTVFLLSRFLRGGKGAKPLNVILLGFFTLAIFVSFSRGAWGNFAGSCALLFALMF